MANPKILLGCPTSDYHEYCLKQYLEAIKGLTYNNFDVLLVDNSKTNKYYNKLKELKIPVIKVPYTENARERIIKSRNVIRQKVLDENYDYFFSLEQDVIPPKDVIESLLKHNRKIVSGVYFVEKFLYDGKIRVQTYLPLLYSWVALDKNGDVEPDRMRYLMPEEVERPKLIKVKACGMGCLLIHRSVLEKIEFRYEGKTGFDDVHFAIDAYKNNFEIWADTGIKCMHLIEKRPWKWSELKI